MSWHFENSIRIFRNADGQLISETYVRYHLPNYGVHIFSRRFGMLSSYHPPSPEFCRFQIKFFHDLLLVSFPNCTPYTLTSGSSHASCSLTSLIIRLEL